MSQIVKKQIKDFSLNPSPADNDQILIQTAEGVTEKTTKSALLNDVNASLFGLQTQIDNLDLNYATDSYVLSVSSNLQSQIDSLDISDTYSTLTPPISSNYTFSGSVSTVIPVDTSSNQLTIKLNSSNIKINGRVRIQDVYANAGNNKVTITDINDIEIGKLNTDDGAIEFAWTGFSWQLIDKFENIWDRDEVTNEITTREGETLVANKMRSGANGVTTTKTVADAINIGANVDQNSDDFGNNLSLSANKFNIGNPNTSNSTPFNIVTAPMWSDGWKLFDDSLSLISGDGNRSLTLDLGVGNGKRISRAILGQYLFITQPGGITVSGSNDDFSYTQLYTSNVQQGVGNIDFTTTGVFRFYKFDFLASRQHSNTYYTELYLYESSYAITNNTSNIQISTGTNTFSPSSFLIYDETSTTINGTGKVNIAYSIDGGAFTSLMDLETFRSLPNIITSTQFDVQIQTIGAIRWSSVSIQTISSVVTLDASGLNYQVNSTTQFNVDPNGLVSAKSSTTGDIAVVYDKTTTDAVNVGANVNIIGSSFSNKDYINTTSFNIGNYNTSSSAPYNISGNGSGTYAPWHAFDGIENSGDSNYWLPGVAPQSLVLNVGVIAKKFAAIRLKRPNVGSQGTIPRSYTVLGSNDNLTYTTLLTVTEEENVELSSWTSLKEFTATGFYLYYKLTCTLGHLTNIYIDTIDFREGTYSTTLNASDITIDTKANIYVPSTLKVYDENDALIVGSGKVNVNYSVDGGSFQTPLPSSFSGNSHDLSFASGVPSLVKISDGTSVNHASFPASNAFDDNASTNTGTDGVVDLAATNVRLKKALIIPSIFGKFTISTASSWSTANLLKNCKLEGFNGSTWNELNITSVSGSCTNSGNIIILNSGNSLSSTIITDNQTAYSEYALRFITGQSGTTGIIGIATFDGELVTNFNDQTDFQSLSPITTTSNLALRISTIGAQKWSRLQLSTLSTVVNVNNTGIDFNVSNSSVFSVDPQGYIVGSNITCNELAPISGSLLTVNNQGKLIDSGISSDTINNLQFQIDSIISNYIPNTGGHVNGTLDISGSFNVIGGSTFNGTIENQNESIGFNVSKKITQVLHNLTVGNAIYFDGVNWLKANASTSVSLGIAIVSKVVDQDTFIAVFMGEIIGLTGLTTGEWYYVSEVTNGLLTTTEGNNFSNPILLATSSTGGTVAQLRANTQSTNIGYSTRSEYDSVNFQFLYTGTAIKGALTSQNVWKISKFDFSSGIITYADGNTLFDNVFDNREALTYI